MPSDPRHHNGQASVEFAAVSALIAAALCLPWAAELSPAEWLLGAIVEAAAAVPAWLAVV